MAYYENDCRTISADAPFLDQAIQDGLIDSLHTWGDFQDARPDSESLRKLASGITNRLIRNGSQIKIWIHHGTLPNYQNIANRLHDGCRGDDPGSPFYTAEFMQKLGIKFCWLGELIDWPLSTHRGNFNPIIFRRLAVNTFKNVVKCFIGRRQRIRSSKMLTDLCYPQQLRNNQTILAFSRFFYHPDGQQQVASRLTYRHCLKPQVLERLMVEQGYLILYTHLAFPRLWNGEMFADIKSLRKLEKKGYLNLQSSQKQTSANLFPHPDMEVLKNLAQHYHLGKIWVTPTVNLLTYWMSWHYLKWHVEENKHRQVIIIDKLDDPTTGPRQPDENELAGLCFYSSIPEKTVIRLGNKDLKVSINPHDNTGRYSLSLALPPLPKLDLLKNE